jgi:hypothetical protein
MKGIWSVPLVIYVLHPPYEDHSERSPGQFCPQISLMKDNWRVQLIGFIEMAGTVFLFFFKWNEVSKLCFHEGRRMAMYEELGVKLLVGYIALFIITRIQGKRNIGQLSVMDFLATLMLSEFLGNALYDTNVQVGEFLFASIIRVI